jgi:TetR/AcrR family transcriptional regulator, fatty acid metabolism regulator protein
MTTDRAAEPARHSKAAARRIGIARRSRDQQRDAILRAAIRTFARHGFSGSQLADIARAANVTPRTMRRRFPDKDDLLVSIFDRMIGEAIDEGRRALESVADPIARLDEIARLHLARVGRDRDLAVVCQVELRQSVTSMERFSSTRLREYLGIIRDAIAAGQARGVFRDGLKPTVAAKLFFGMLDQMATNWVLSPRRYALEAESALVVDLFVNGLASRPVVPVGPADPPAAARTARRGASRR